MAQDGVFAWCVCVFVCVCVCCVLIQGLRLAKQLLNHLCNFASQNVHGVLWGDGGEEGGRQI
jgi:hypothetical protein